MQLALDILSPTKKSLQQLKISIPKLSPIYAISLAISFIFFLSDSIK
jgi:hypothetical protein